ILAQILPSIQDTYDLAIDNLKVGSSYSLQIVALDKTGATISQTGADFQFQPPAAQFSISKVITPSQAAPFYTIQVQSVNQDGVARFHAWLQPDGKTDQLNSNVVAFGTPITVSTNNLAAGVYTIGVEAIDINGNV